MRQSHASELIGVISVHTSELGLWRGNLIMRDCNLFSCKAKAATESHYRQWHMELQLIFGDYELDVLKGPGLCIF